MTPPAVPDARAALESLVEMALAEDVGPGDRTTEWTVPPAVRGRAGVVAKEELVLAGTAAAAAVFGRVDPELEVAVHHGDGSRVGAGTEVLAVSGALASILTAERTALNFLGRLGGIATATRRYVDAVRGTGARVVDTRKTTPGWRFLEKAAVRAGGGTNHRMGLHDMVMIKDNHIAAAGGIEPAVRAVRERNGLGLPVEVEVVDLEGLEEVLPLGVDRILLDNMEPGRLRAAVERVRRHPGEPPELEASGNVTLETIREIARTGVDLVSVGWLTHSAPSADLSLRVTSVEEAHG